MPNTPNPSPSRRRRRAGFTLVELLVVIGIITVLVGILVPTISKMKQRSYATSTAAQIQLLSGSIQQYFNVFNAYPGMLDDTDPQVRSATNTTTGFTTSEELVMCLCGGGRILSFATTPYKLTFNGNDVGQGPLSLTNPAIMTPKRYPAFADPVAAGIDPVRNGNTWFAWKEPPGNIHHQNVTHADLFNDSTAPEFVDRFPDALPILYIRAKPGATGVTSWAPGGGVPAAWDPGLLTPYQAFPNTSGGQPMLSKDPNYVWSSSTSDPHNQLFKDAAYYFAEPVDQTTAYSKLVPRQKSGYLLISAGIDRVYMTPDDITNIGAMK